MIMTTSSWRMISVFLSLSVVLAPFITARVWADSPVTVSFNPPPGRNAPRGGTVGGGSRPVQIACLSNPSANSGSFTAIAPGSHIGLSQSDRPNLYVYIPQTTAQTAEFSLFDEHKNGIYQVSVPVSQTGLVRMGLPDTAPSLAPDQPYYWTVALVCNPSDRMEDWVVGGWVEHVSKDNPLPEPLENITDLEKVTLYAQEGFWYDALNILVELQRSQPNNPAVANSWTELMESVGLEEISLTVPSAIATQSGNDK